MTNEHQSSDQTQSFQAILDALAQVLEKAGERIASHVASKVVAVLDDAAGSLLVPADSSSRPASLETMPAQQQQDRKKITRRRPAKICSVEGCDKPARARGLCSRHYQRQRNAERRRAEGEQDLPRRGHGQCQVEGCQEVIYARQMCSKHFMQWVREKRKES